MLQRSFHIVTFGCQMNVNDSLWLKSSLYKKGFEETSLETAGVVIINTCSVREKPEQKVYNMLSRIQYLTKNSPHLFVVVAGCVAQQVGDIFFKKFPQVRIVSGSDGIVMTPEAIERLYIEPELRLNLTDFTEHYPERETILSSHHMDQITPVSPVAYVNIMQGCDNYCSYCIVPYTRGKQKSRAVGAILEECQLLLTNGVKELILLGQNVNAYGLDIDDNRIGFSQLVRQIAVLPGLERLRFFTSHPKDFSSDVIELFADFSTICPRLHLPLQSGSDVTLQHMERKYDIKHYLQVVSALKDVCPDIALSTDFIVGFPGETEEDFLQTLEVMDTVGFMSSFSFCYSDRPGTQAITLPHKVDTEVKGHRLARLQEKQTELGIRWLESRKGLETTVLLENMSRKNTEDNICWQGRDPWGDLVNVPFVKDEDMRGRLLPVRITAAKKHSLVAEPLSFCSE